MQSGLTGRCTYAHMFANWGKYQRHGGRADADLSPQIKHATDAAGSLPRSSWVTENIYICRHTRWSTNAFGCSLWLNKQREKNGYFQQGWKMNLNI